MTARKSNGLWNAYLRGVERGTFPSLAALGTPGLQRRGRLGLLPEAAPSTAARRGSLGALLRQWSELYGGEEDEEQVEDRAVTERKLVELGKAFIEAAEKGNVARVRSLVEGGFPVNFQHPKNRETALHAAAACTAKEVVDLLLETGECDLLLPDALGKYAWNNAAFFGTDLDLEERLLTATNAQAIRDGVNLREIHRANLRKWFQEPWFQTLSRE